MSLVTNLVTSVEAINLLLDMMWWLIVFGCFQLVIVSVALSYCTAVSQ